MALWQPDTCQCRPGCQIETDDATGEPIRLVFRCSNHAAVGHDHADIAAECRAKERARAKVRQDGKLADDVDVPWAISLDRKTVMTSLGEELSHALPEGRSAEALTVNARGATVKGN